MNYQLHTDPDEMEELSTQGLKVRNAPHQRKGKKLTNQSITRQVEFSVAENDESRFPFSYHASRYEKEWLMASMKEIYEQNWIEDITRMVRGGKEATVYLCRAPSTMSESLLAAKVYRPRRFRNLKNDHLYREGRNQLDATGKVILDDRQLHAMDKHTDYGLRLLHSSWIGHEFRTMKMLDDAGVDLPRPYVSSDNVILMDYVGDGLTDAPTLNTVTLTSREAARLYERVVFDIELMLLVNRVHADLSAYNILYWQGEIKLIDFPQAIDPDENHGAYRIFSRDLARVCSYFETQGVKTDPRGLAARLWKEKGRLVNTAIDLHYLDPENEEDVWCWKSAGA